MKFNNAISKIILALLLACIAGYFIEPQTILFGVPVSILFGLIGELFLNSLNLVVVPLVASSIILGAARLGGEESVGNLGLKTFASFFLTITTAVLIGYVVNTMNLYRQPGTAQSLHRNFQLRSKLN